MMYGTYNITALSNGPPLFTLVSFIWNMNMLGIPLEIPLRSSDRDGDLEQRMDYWREDAGVNLYHLHWHMSYPFDFPDTPKKNRRGELFYYLHQQIIARYNVERLCNGLSLATPLENWDEPIPEHYYPILNCYISSKNYPIRLPKTKFRSVNRTDLGMELDIVDLIIKKNRIFRAISKKTVIAANGTKISIDNDHGIDILGNIIESSFLSPDQNFYGSLHNTGHSMLAVISDPEYKHNQSTGVLFRPNTSMRDPLFYRWHSFLNDLFDEHKSYLRPYDKSTLSFPGVRVTNVNVISYRNGKYGREKNTLHTYMSKSDINMTTGLDFMSKRPVLVRLTHQDNDDFDYVIECSNDLNEELVGTVRIFLMPILGFHGAPMKLAEQRSLAIEMDKFVQPLKPGVNRIVRKSTDSSVTVPFEQTFHDITVANKVKDLDEYERFKFCGCGWPHHLLVPRGTAEGYPALLFAMITDARVDRTDLLKDLNPKPSKCKRSESICGLVDRKYPDKRSAGFPFDRPAGNNVDTIEAFLTPNMAIKQITIFHSNEVREGRILPNVTPLNFESINVTPN